MGQPGSRCWRENREQKGHSPSLEVLILVGGRRQCRQQRTQRGASKQQPAEEMKQGDEQNKNTVLLQGADPPVREKEQYITKLLSGKGCAPR